MKKKVALFGNAWGYEYFQMILRGVKQYAADNLVDVDIFVTYSTEKFTQEDKDGEMNIFYLPDLSQYDGVILLANSLNIDSEKEFFQKKLKKAGIPSICLEYEMAELPYMGSENYTGMYELAEHLFRDHGYKEVLYIGGPENHSEAAERMKAVLDAARQYDVPLSKDKIYYGDWSFRSGLGVVEQYIKDHGKCPEAIICANDTSAMGIIAQLPYMGFAPGVDVAVTGFDALQKGALEQPALTTVGRRWNAMGRRAMEIILDEEWDEEKLPRIILKSELIKRESCGCSVKSVDAMKAKMEMIREAKEHRFIGSVELDIHMRSLYGVMHNCHTAEELHETLTQFVKREGQFYEMDMFSLCLNPYFFEEEIDSQYTDVRNLKKVLALGTVYNSEIYDMEEVVFPQLIPTCFENDEQSNVLFFVPLHLDGVFAGYAVMKAYELHLNETAMFVWSKHVMQYLQQIRQNVQIQALTNRLKRLSATDGMTGLYNRRGVTDLVQPFYESRVAEQTSMAVIMCDIDGMKEINDQFGHLQGDLAICTLANAIKDSIADDWYACRYGGDEFIVVGKCENDKRMNELLHRIETNIEVEISKSKAPFELGVSIGGVMIHEEDNLSFEMAIKLADDRMYRIKSKHKQQSGGEVR